MNESNETSEILELMKKQTDEIKRQNDLHEQNLIAVENKTQKYEELKILKNQEIEQNKKLLALKNQEINTSIEQTKSIKSLIETSKNMIRGIEIIFDFIKKNPTQKGIDLILSFLQNSNAPILLHILNSLNDVADKNELIDKLHDMLIEIGKTRTEINTAPSFDIEGDFTSKDFKYIGGSENTNTNN